MKVTTKGQVTIPQSVRELLGIEPGSEVEFVVGPDGVRLVRAPLDRAAEIVARMKAVKIPRSTEEIMALTRNYDEK